MMVSWFVGKVRRGGKGGRRKLEEKEEKEEKGSGGGPEEGGGGREGGREGERRQMKLAARRHTALPTIGTKCCNMPKISERGILLFLAPQYQAVVAHKQTQQQQRGVKGTVPVVHIHHQLRFCFRGGKLLR